VERPEHAQRADCGAGNSRKCVNTAGRAGDKAAAVRRTLPHRLALFGLPAVVAEPVTLLAEILGWQVVQYPAGMATRPGARACLAMLPACSAVQSPPLVLWSPENNLNEHISRSGLSIMDQPLCITRVEQMLEALTCEP
jgi:hypothetical protein